MPSAQIPQIPDPTQGPFSQYLQPVQPRTIDQPMPAPTGYETHPAAAGEVALSFLQGLRKNRVAAQREEDGNVQTQIDNFRSYVNGQLQNPDLDDEGRNAIQSLGNTILNKHMHYELQQVPKDAGVAGFFKNLLVHATGGPMKVREPINWDEATGQITNAVQGHSQRSNFQSYTSEAQQAMDALKRANPNPTAQDVQRALYPTYLKVIQKSPNYAGAFAQTMGMGFPEAGSAQYWANEMKRVMPGTGGQPTGQPPAGGAPPAQQSPDRSFTPANYTPVPPTAPPPGAPGAQAQPAAAAPATIRGEGGLMYMPGYGPQQWAALQGAAGAHGSGFEISPAHPVAQLQDGAFPTSVRTTGRMVTAPGDPNASGYWDAQTGQRLAGRVMPVSTSASHKVYRSNNGFAVYWDPDFQREMYSRDPEGNAYKIPERLVGIMDPDGGTKWVTPTEALGHPTQMQALANIRYTNQTDNERNTRLIANEATFGKEKLHINQTYDNLVNQARDKSINTALNGMASLGLQVDPKVAEQAMQNPQVLVNEIEKQRQRQLSDAESIFNREKSAIDLYLPGSKNPQTPTATPPGGSAAPPAPPAQQPPAATPKVPMPDPAAVQGLRKKPQGQ